MTPPRPNSRASDLSSTGTCVPVEPGDQQLSDLAAERAWRHACYDSNSRGGSRAESIIAVPCDIAASAPTRIDLAGGTIDIWPLYLFHDGAATLNAAISLRAHVTVEASPDDLVELQSLDTAREVSARHWSELDPAGQLPLLARRRAPLPRRARQRDHAGRIAGRRRHRRVVRADHRALRRARPTHRRVHESGRSAAGRDEYRVPDHSCADRRAGLSARDVRRHRGDRAPARTASSVSRSTSTPGSSNSESSSPTPESRGIRARTTGRSPSGTSTAIATSSTASSGFATRRPRCARR